MVVFMAVLYLDLVDYYRYSVYGVSTVISAATVIISGVESVYINYFSLLRRYVRCYIFIR